MKKLLLVISCALALGFIPKHAAAANIPLAIGDDWFVGTIVDSIPPSGELTYVQNLITLEAGDGDTIIGTETYNREFSTIPKAVLPPPTTMLKTDTDMASAVIVNGWTYILGKYDAADAGALVFFIDGLPEGDTVTLPQTFNGHDISHYSVFGTGDDVTAPDGGATLMLLGGALVGLGALRRKFNV